MQSLIASTFSGTVEATLNGDLEDPEDKVQTKKEIAPNSLTARQAHLKMMASTIFRAPLEHTIVRRASVKGQRPSLQS